MLLFVAATACAYSTELQDLPPDVGQSSPEQEYWAQIEARNWAEAALAAQQLVAIARNAGTTPPFDLAEALTLLGNAQVAARDYTAAEASFSEALLITQPYVVASSDKLLDPMRGMGYALAYAERHAQAIPYLERALLISRRTFGLFDMNQQGLLRQLATSLRKVGLPLEAEQHMQYLVRVGEHTYGKRDPRMANIYDVLGDFYMEGAAVNSARRAYRQALDVVERARGRNDLATVQPLRAYADSYRQELNLALFGIRAPDHQGRASVDVKSINPKLLSADGERALKRALKILDSDPSRPTSLLFDTLLDLGDWYMVKGDEKEALNHYRRAASLLDDVEADRNTAARAKLSFPVRVYYPIPASALRNVNRPAAETEDAFVHVVFRVAADGTVKDERVLEANASERLIEDTVNAIRAARYRPKFSGGEPVETDEVSLRQIFKLRREREAG
jgi:tetratricopeptide (TPR) repeat protein